MDHDWKPSTLGHGETMCARCKITNREAAVLGELQCPILVGCTYETPKRQKLYVHDITGGKVTYCRVGDVTRRDISYPKFAGWVETQVPNG